jgi:hypothetical protein
MRLETWEHATFIAFRTVSSRTPFPDACHVMGRVAVFAVRTAFRYHPLSHPHIRAIAKLALGGIGAEEIMSSTL